MKICPRCKKSFSDEYSFCNNCGCSLDQVPKPDHKMIVAIGIVALIAIVVLGGAVSEKRKVAENRKEIENYKYNKAVEEYRSTPRVSDLRINSDWTKEKDRNYIYIKGSVTNTSLSKTISYFEVEAKFYDDYGNVIDSDWTNDSKDLEPGDTRQFEIMHRYNSDEKDIRLSIKDVR